MRFGLWPLGLAGLRVGFVVVLLVGGEFGCHRIGVRVGERCGEHRGPDESADNEGRCGGAVAELLRPTRC